MSQRRSPLPVRVARWFLGATFRPSTPLARTACVASAVLAVAVAAVAAGYTSARVEASPSAGPAASPAAAPLAQLRERINTLRLHGLYNVCYDCNDGRSNMPATAGSNSATDPNTGNVPEDPPYTDPKGPFSPLSNEAPEFDYATWNPAWISERLGELVGEWPGLTGVDEISRATNIRIGGVNGSEKVWLRHWYEPTRLDKDLNADSCLTDEDGDGVADTRVNPGDFGAGRDEWYPAIMTELTYMLLDNDLPEYQPRFARLDDSAPRPACGTAGRTRFVFPVGTQRDALDPAGPLTGRGLTSLDVDFDGSIDMVNVTSEELLAAQLGVDLDFDGDNVLDDIDPDGRPLSCDEMVVLHTDATTIGRGDELQFLDHFVRVRSVSDGSAVLEVWYNGDLLPRPVSVRSIGVGAAALAGDVGPLQVFPAGSGNLGTVPIGAWFVFVEAADVNDGLVTLVVGRALGAPCASMEDAPNAQNLSAGGPWFLKRFYVDGHEFNTVAVMTCDTDEFQYITLRAPLPKVDTIIEQHSVRLEGYDRLEALALPPPFNYEHTILEDISYFERFWQAGFSFLDLLAGPLPREDVYGWLHYMGGPIGPVAPVLHQDEPLTYTGRDPANPVGPYTDYLATHWLYVDEDVNPSYVGELREKYGAVDPQGAILGPDVEESFFFNEQIFTRPWHFTEFIMPNLPDPAPDPETEESAFNPDGYLVTSGWYNTWSRQRLWTMPDDGVPPVVPPTPPDLTAEVGTVPGPRGPYGAPRRASFLFDPDVPDKVFANEDGARIYGGFPIEEAVAEVRECIGIESRPSILLGAGDTAVTTDTAGYPVEVLPYTDAFAPFNPQHPHAPRTDSMTFNPAYMDEFRNFFEDLRFLYQQIANNAQNARQKVYHRLWYQPEYVTKVRIADDCDRDLTFPAMMQEFTYLFMDTTDNPIAVPMATSRFAFPIATRSEELPVPNPGGTLPAGGSFGHGLTTFDANFDGFDEATTVHSEESLAGYLDSQWQANRPLPPGPPPPPLPGPRLDFDGDGNIDDLDEDCTSLNGNELLVLAVESLTLDRDRTTPESHAAMFLDHLVTLENVTPGSSAQVRVYFTGGNPTDARPEAVRGIQTLDIGDALIVDRFQDSVTKVRPGEVNLSTDGAWFVFLEDVATDDERITITVGRALGATHAAIDDGAGNHNLTPGNPWYLKRFYADGHEYNVVALMTQVPTSAGPLPGAPGSPIPPDICNEGFAFLTIRTPVPKGNFFNPQDSLFQQGYFLDGLPDRMSVMPPFNVDHTIAVDIERIEAREFAWIDGFGRCVGPLAPAEPMVERILEERHEPRFGTELRETYHGRDGVDGSPPEYRDPSPLRDRDGWEVHQDIVTPWNFTDIELPDGQQYLLTLNWRTTAGKLAFYGCTRDNPGPFTSRDDLPGLSPFELGLTHQQIAAAAVSWAPPPGSQIIPPPNLLDPPQTMPENDDGDDTILPYYDAQCGPVTIPRVKIFYDPTNTDDPYVNRRTVDLPVRTADLRLEKRASSGTVAAGGDLVYTLTVFNDGPDDIPGATITDQLPPGTTYVSDTDGCSETLPGVLTCTVGALAAGASDSFVITVSVDDMLPDGTTLTNRAGALAPAAIDPDPTNNTAEAVTIVRSSADLRVTKSASDVTPRAGQQLVYTVNVFNGGPSTAENVVVVDTLPAGATYVSDTDSCVQGPPGTLTCSLGDIDNGDMASFAITVEIGAAVADGTVLVNSAVGSSDAVDPDDTNNEGLATIIVTAEADLRITKSASDPNPIAGTEITYTVAVHNGGPSDAPAVQVVDQLPAGMTYISDSDSCVQGPVGTLTCGLGAIAASDMISFTIRARVNANVPGGTVLTNRAEVMAGGADDPDAGNNVATASVITRVSADLSIEKRGPAAAQAGDRIQYTLVVTNLGPSSSPAGASITDTLPAGATYVSDTGGCDTSGLPTLVCAVPPLAPSASHIVNVVVDIDPALSVGGAVVNRAIVGASFDGNPANNSSSATTVITSGPSADLSVDKTAADTVAAGSALVYTISVSNAGPDGATGVVVTDTLPAAVTFVSSTVPCVETPPASGIYVCDVGAIPASDNTSFSITVLVDGGAAGTTLNNGVAVGADTSDPDPLNNVDGAATSVLPSSTNADLEMEKLGPATINPGEQIVYTLNVINHGSISATGVQVTDLLPSGTTYSSTTAPGGCVPGGAPNSVLCTVGTIGAGDSASFTITVDTDGGLSDGEVLGNLAIVTSSTPDDVPGNNVGSATTLVESPGDTADLSIVKTAGSPTVVAGGILTYTIAVENAGPLAVANVRVTDSLPSELTYVSDTSGPGGTSGCVDVGSSTLLCDLGPMSAGDRIEFLLTTLVDPGVPSGTAIINTVVVGPGIVVVGPDDAGGALGFAPQAPSQAPVDPDPTNNTSSATSVASRMADLNVRKSSSTLTPVVGEAFDYVLNVRNAGPSDADNVVLTESLPPQLEYISDTAGCDLTGIPSLSCDLGTLTAGSTAQVTVTARVATGVDVGTPIPNTASVTSDEPDPDTSDNSANKTLLVAEPTDADLALTKTASDTTPQPGEIVTFTLTVDNLGPADAAGVQLVDTLPASMTYVSNDSGCSAAGLPSVSCSLGTIAGGGSVQVRITASVSPAATDGQIIDNSASVSSSTPDPASGNNTGAISLLVVDPPAPSADLVIRKSASSLSPVAGDLLTYTLRVTNTGPTAAQDVTVTDNLPSGAGYVADNAGCDISALPAISCGLGTLQDDTSAEVQIVVALGAALSSGAMIENSASVGSSTPDPDSSDNSSSMVVFVQRVSDMRIDKTATPNPVAAGGRTVYTLRVDNLGPSDADNVIVSETLPAGTAYVSDSAACDIGALPTLTCDLGTVGANQFTIVQVTVDVLPDAAASLSNTAGVDSDSEDINPANNSATMVLSVIAPDPADLQITKTVSDANPVPGSQIDYRLRVDNLSPRAASNVIVRDTLPAGLSYVSDNGGCNVSALPEIACDVGSLAGSSAATVVIRVQVDAGVPVGTVITNRARVSSTTPDPNGSNNQARVGVEVVSNTGVPSDVRCGVGDDRIQVRWVDASDFETSFDIEVSVSGSPFVALASLASSTTAETGQTYMYETDPLPASTDYRFRVRAVGGERTTAFSEPTETCSTAPEPGTGCYEGKVELQGRTDHSGVVIQLDGVPAAVTDRFGNFKFCGVTAGKHKVTAGASCYRPAWANSVMVADETISLPYTTLPGGDTNNDGSVNLYDLVTVGAAYRTTPPSNPAADCTDDGTVNLFDLVLVGSNYGKAGPVNFGTHLGPAPAVGGGVSPTTLASVAASLEHVVPAVGGSGIAGTAGARGTVVGGETAPATRVEGGLPINSDGSVDALELRVRQVDDGDTAVDVMVRGVRGLYAAEIGMEFDTSRVAVVDANPGRPGVQVEPGEAWASGLGFVSENSVDQSAGTLLFAATRMNPAPPIEGDAALLTVVFRPLVGAARDAWSISSALLLDRGGKPIDFDIDGNDLRSVGDWASLTEHVLLPYAARADRLD